MTHTRHDQHQQGEGRQQPIRSSSLRHRTGSPCAVGTKLADGAEVGTSNSSQVRTFHLGVAQQLLFDDHRPADAACGEVGDDAALEFCIRHQQLKKHQCAGTVRQAGPGLHQMPFSLFTGVQ